VERLYAVLTARFHIALHPARHVTVESMVTVAKAVAILHNMVTEKRRDGYVSRTQMAAAAQAEAGGSGGGAEGSWNGAAETPAAAGGAAGVPDSDGAGRGGGGGTGLIPDGGGPAAGVGAAGGGAGGGGGGGKSIPTNVGPTPYCAHVAETWHKLAVGQFSGRVTMSNVHAALPTEVKRVKTRMYLRPTRGRSRWPRGQRVANRASVGNSLALGPTGSKL